MIKKENTEMVTWLLEAIPEFKDGTALNARSQVR
jgi:hypothetical protein